MDHPYLGKISVSLEPFKLVYDDLMKPGESAPGSDALSALPTGSSEFRTLVARNP